MAIPTKPLTLNDFEPKRMTLDEVALFATSSMSVFERVVMLRQFLIDHTDWTKDEIGKLELGELDEVAAQLRPALEAAAVPLAKGPRSKTGRGKHRASRRVASPTG